MRSTEARGVLLPASEVATRLGVSKQTVWRMARDGELPAVRLAGRVGATVRFDQDALERWIAEHTIGGAA